MRLAILIAGVSFAAALGAANAQIQPPLTPPAAGPSVTAGGTAPAATVRPKPGTFADDETLVCRYERDTGTLMMVQVCRTERAWKAMQSDAQEFMEFGFRGSHQVDDAS
jgi:hypothetical protein